MERKPSNAGGGGGENGAPVNKRSKNSITSSEDNSDDEYSLPSSSEGQEVKINKGSMKSNGGPLAGLLGPLFTSKNSKSKQNLPKSKANEKRRRRVRSEIQVSNKKPNKPIGDYSAGEPLSTERQGILRDDSILGDLTKKVDNSTVGGNALSVNTKTTSAEGAKNALANNLAPG